MRENVVFAAVPIPRKQDVPYWKRSKTERFPKAATRAI